MPRRAPVQRATARVGHDESPPLPFTRVVRLIGVVSLTAAASAFVATPVWGDANSDKAQIAALGSRIAQDGAVVQQLVASYDQAQGHEAAVDAELDAARTRVAADRRAEKAAIDDLRKIALDSYMTGTSDPALALFASGNATALEASQEYVQVATGSIDNTVDAVNADVQRTESEEARLRSDQTQAQASVQQLADADQAAQAALARDNALLGQVQGNLQTLLAASARQRQAAEEDEEEEMAAQAAQAAKAAQAANAAQGQAPTITVSVDPSAGSYADPLRTIDALTPERIDQGVDYSGYGPIYAIGDGVVLSTVNAGWPGGTFISYRLVDGQANGLVVYAAEDIDPSVKVGQSVTTGTVLGTMYEGPDGIETGWADPSGDGVTMAMDARQFSGANSTAFGANFSQLLASLGAPPGVPQNEPPTGSLPPGWPVW